MPRSELKWDLGDGDELRLEILPRLVSGHVKLNVHTPDGRIGLTAEPEEWVRVIAALTASMLEDPGAG